MSIVEMYENMHAILAAIFAYFPNSLLLLLSSNIAKSSKVPSRYNNDVESNCRNKLV